MSTLFCVDLTWNDPYYFVADRGETGVRVLRVCECNQSCSSQSFEALYELQLLCTGSGGGESTEVCGVTLLESFANQNEPMVVVSQCDGGTRNRICGYLLSDIDQDMDTAYENCRGNVVANFKLPWEQMRPCTGFSVSSSYMLMFNSNMAVIFCSQQVLAHLVTLLHLQQYHVLKIN